MYTSAMRAVLSIVAMLLSVTVATPSTACAVWRSPEQTLSDGYRVGAISAVALVTIRSARYTHEPVGDAHFWSADATIERVVRGTYRAKTVQFKRGGGSAACEERPPLPLPKPGDRWVVYLWKRPQGDYAVWRTYPSSVAAGAYACGESRLAIIA
jgi:hypothetical protein